MKIKVHKEHIIIQKTPRRLNHQAVWPIKSAATLNSSLFKSNLVRALISIVRVARKKQVNRPIFEKLGSLVMI